MASLLSQAFQNAKSENRPALLTYTVAGDNTKKKSLEILKSISNYADICELGFPHNTPIADGGQIQTSAYRAIKNGIKINDVFSIAKDFKKSKLHAAPLSRNAKIGILHGAASYLCQNSEGQINDTESISAGLDYPGVSPIHCFLKDTRRARYTYATDEDALNAHVMVTKFENLNPSLEPSHAFAEAIKIAPKLSKDTIIIVNSCGDAKKDRDILRERLGKR